jgi:hypothetical protein
MSGSASLTLEQVLARSLRPRRGGGYLGMALAVPPPREIVEPKLPIPTYRKITNQDRKIRNSADLASILKTAGRMQDWASAIEHFGAALHEKHVTPNPMHYSLLVQACCECGRLDAIRVLMEGAAKAGLPIAKDPKVKEQLIHAYGRSEQWFEAVSLLSTMAVTNEATTNSFNGALAACERGKAWETALSIFSFMKASPPPSASSPRAVPCAPDAVSYAAVISCLESCRKQSELQALVQEMPSDQKERLMSTYAALIQVWASRHGRHR